MFFVVQISSNSYQEERERSSNKRPLREKKVARHFNTK
jgi:hypothetical protein